MCVREDEEREVNQKERRESTLRMTKHNRIGAS
jgi:hypothetical protein